jgi:diguanylate cyclase (GGDEF)-like protein/PAS domain S-box-containing protein
VSTSARDTTQHADALLARAEQAASAAVRELPEALVVVFDDAMRLMASAGHALTRAGDSRSIAEGQAVAGAFRRDVWASMQPLFASALEGETRSREIWTADQEHCLMVDAGPLRSGGADEHGTPRPAGIAVLLDITARRRAELYSRSAPVFADSPERAPIGTGLLDSDGRWLLVSRPLCDITGYTADELLGTRFDGIVHPEDTHNDDDERARLLAGEIPAFQTEKRYFDAAGETVSAILSMSLIRDRGGAPLHYVAQLQDISERKRLEESLRELADHDQLTGVRNRRLFEHDLMLQVARSQRYGETAGLLVIDVDALGQINEEHGSDVGDEILGGLARALTRRLRQTDLVGRIGGGEFAVLLPHIDHDGIAVVADGLLRVIPAYSVDTGATVLHPSASIGSLLVDRRATSAEQVLGEARRSMQIAKYATPSSPS